MKKSVLLITALFCFAMSQADVLLKESFNYEPGRLSQGTMQDDMFDGLVIDQDNWYASTQNSTNYINVVEANLTYAGYQTEAAGKAIAFAGNANKDVRAFNTVQATAGNSLYYSLLLNVKTLKGTTADFIFGLMPDKNNTASAYQFAQLKLVGNEGLTTYKLGISKSNEGRYRLYNQNLELNKTYLVVVRYDFVDGEKNDVVSMWINPTKTSEASVSLVCVQDSMNAAGTMQLGAMCKDDAAYLSLAYLHPTSNTPTDATIDEVRVATKWANLFEAGSSESDPEIGVPENVSFGMVYTGEKAEQKINITAENLSEDLAISNTNTELTLSTNAIAKSVAMSGTTLTLTLNPKVVGAQTDKITITSGELVKEVNVSWTTVPVTDCATLADLKKAAAEAAQAEKDTLLRFTGTATVTRDTLEVYFLQDNTGAIRVDGAKKLWPGSINVGDNLTGFRATNGGASLGIQPIEPMSVPKVLSSGNKVTPQVVTLSALQASPADYLLELVTIEGVSLDNSSGTFSAGDFAMTQGDKSATMKVEMGIGITGLAIPETANVTGFSFNQYGTIIVPRSAADIVNKSKKLLQNGGFEEFTTGSFMGVPTAEYTYWSFSGGGTGLSTEGTDVKEGANAFKTSSEFKIDGTLYQSVDVSNFNTGDEFELRIYYKVLTPQGDNSIALASYWASAKEGALIDDADKLKVTLENATDWKKVTVRTKKPEKATKFEFTLSIAAKVIVLLDDFGFEYVEPEAYFSVTPETVTSVQANINTEVPVATFTVRQKGLTQPVKLELGGKDAAMFALEKNQVTAAEETFKVTYKPTAVGHHTAALHVTDDESAEISLFNRMISLSGTAIDPTKTPVITINPTTLPAFKCAAQTEQTATVKVSSENCTDFVYAKIEQTKGHAFLIDGSMLPQNIETQTVVTFKPTEEGEYAATITWSTEGGESVSLNVIGTATAPTPGEVDYETEFVWNETNPLDMMDEGFDNAADFRNKTLKVAGWQNVVTKGSRAWWGYNTDTTVVAKATGYIYNVSKEYDYETWLVTPALNFKTSNPKHFGFSILGEIIFDGQQGGVEVYYVDATVDPVHMEHIEAVDALIPANNNELANQWVPVVADLTGQPLADVFHIAFRFFDKAGANGVTYQLDNVSWGKQLLATDRIEAPANTDIQLILQNGQILIRRADNIYTLDGRLVK